MRRWLTGSVLLAAAWVATATAAGVAPRAAAAVAPRAALTGFYCQTARNPLNRAISVTAVMRPQAGTQRMELKFELLRRWRGERRFEQVRYGDLGTWRHPTNPPTLGQQPGDVWRETKQVADLGAPAVYRFRVIFRWVVPSGYERTVLYSPSCRQS